MVNLWQEEDGKKVAEVWVLPGYGANLCRFKVDNIDYLYPAPQKLVDIRHYGTPVLYPTPGIVRGEKFTFDGSLYRFPANRGSIFRHGFAMGQKFLFSEPIVSEDGVTLKTSLGIFRDHPLYYLFPIANRLDIDFTLKNRSVRIDITVTDLDTQKRFPFGFGLHPCFNLIGPREENLIQVPVKMVGSGGKSIIDRMTARLIFALRQLFRKQPSMRFDGFNFGSFAIDNLSIRREAFGSSCNRRFYAFCHLRTRKRSLCLSGKLDLLSGCA